MYKELAFLFIGVIIGIISMYYIMRSQIGNKYEIDADIKNKKGVMNDNIFEGAINLESKKKEGILKRIKNRRLTKKRKNV